ncbi:MAG: hypothetical protein V4600_32415, partial [Pseudomonadota bacterium]
GWGRGILPNQKVFFRVSLTNKKRPAAVQSSAGFVFFGKSRHQNSNMEPGVIARTQPVIRNIRNVETTDESDRSGDFERIDSHGKRPGAIQGFR